MSDAGQRPWCWSDLSVAVLALVLVGLPIERAGAQPPTETSSEEAVHRAGVEVGFYSGGGATRDLTVFTVLGEGAFALTPSIELRAVGGIVRTTFEQAISGDDPDVFPRGESFSFGNPSLGIYRFRNGRALQYDFGLSVAAPLARGRLPHDGDDAARALGYDFAIRARGGNQPWLFLPEAVSAIVSGSLAYDSGPVRVGGTLETAGMLCTGSDAYCDVRGAVEWTVHPGLYVDVPPYDHTRIGMMVTGAYTPTEPGDVAQHALAPYGRLIFEQTYFDARMVINLDPPSGFSFEPNGVWGLFVRGGGFL